MEPNPIQWNEDTLSITCLSGEEAWLSSTAEQFSELPIPASFAAKLFSNFLILSVSSEVRIDVSPSGSPCREALGLIISRFFEFLDLEPGVLIAAQIYMIRIFAIHRDIVLTNVSASRLVLAAITVAGKMHSDRCFTNLYVASVFGLNDVKLLNDMEKEFLALIDFNLSITKRDAEWMMGCCVQNQ